MSEPILALLPGDPCGVGPEIVARYLAGGNLPEGVRLAVLGAEEVLADGMRIINEPMDIPKFNALEDVPDDQKVFLLRTNSPPTSFDSAQMTEETGAYAFQTLAAAISMAKTGQIQAVATAPFNKEALTIGGITAKNEFELLKKEFNKPDIHGEINVLGDLWTTRVTSHIPIGEIPAFMEKGRILECIQFLDREMRAGGIQDPKIAFAALNPHGGDGGMCGREEIDAIAPAVEAAIESGLSAVGPYPADTLFLRIEKENIDGVLGMYHDQIQIPSKLLRFDQGVTLIGGLPIPYTTCSHGTAYDIAGKGIAKISAFTASVELAAKIAVS
jgi:4-hydroxy-L-threonine phosphate dehydrogenase PdxA